MSAEINPEFMTQIQTPVLPVSTIKTEPPTVIKNEPLTDEESDSDIKDIDIVSHIIYEDSIKSETVSKDILESKHSESVETQVIVKAEKAPFVKIENIIPSENINKTENANNGNVCEGTGQDMVEVQGSNENFDCYRTYTTTLWEEEKEKVKVIKAPRIPVEQHEYTSLAKEKYVCNQCQSVFNKLHYVKFHIKQMHREVTTMYQCPYCPFKSKWSIRYHIILKHKDIKDIQKFEYHCNKCNCKTYSLQAMKRHKLTHLKPEEIQYYYCYHCSYKTMRKGNLITHFSRHFKNEQIKRGKRYCDKCDYYTYTNQNLKAHKLIHLKPEEIQYFYCYHCSYKSNGKNKLKAHIFRHFKNKEVTFHCYICDFMTLKRDLIIEHFKKHSEHYSTYDETQYKYLLETHTRKREKRYLCDKCDYKTYGPSLLNRHKIVHLKPEELQYFYCYHCSHKSKQKSDLKVHISRHFKNKHVPFHCYICDFMTLKRDLIIKHIKNHAKLKLPKLSHKTETKNYHCNKCDYNTFRRDQLNWHKLTHLKPKEIQKYFYCYHCSHKSKRKDNLKNHIFNHFKNEEVTFHCYICDFMTPKRDLIDKHIQKHSKVPIKSEIKDEN